MSKIVYEVNKIDNNGLVLDPMYKEWFAISREDGILFDEKPRPVNEHIECPTTIENVSRVMFDGSYECYPKHQCDPLFLALFPTKEPQAPVIPLGENQYFSSRNVYRKLSNVFLTPYLPRQITAHRFFTAPKDFTIHIEKIGSMILLQSGERFSPVPGGYGSGLVELLTTPEKHDINYYQLHSFTLGSCSLMIKNEVDGIDQNENVVEIKSTKMHPRFPISPEYYLNLWVQNVFGNSVKSMIGLHDGRGQLKSIETLTMRDIEKKALLNFDMKKNLFAHLEDFLTWIRNELSSAGENQQAIISYDVARNTFGMEILYEDNFSLPIISEEWRTLLKEATVSC
jgi:hypothetical protein